MSITDFFKAVWKFITGKQGQDILRRGLDLAEAAEPFVKAFADASGNTTLQSVVAGYEKYGLPVTEALKDGKLTNDEVKALADLGVRLALKNLNPGLTGTSAGIANLLAYTKVVYK